MRAFSLDLRLKVMGYINEGHSVREASDVFNITK
jgi:transposase